MVLLYNLQTTCVSACVYTVLAPKLKTGTETTHGSSSPLLYKLYHLWLLLLLLFMYDDW